MTRDPVMAALIARGAELERRLEDLAHAASTGECSSVFVETRAIKDEHAFLRHVAELYVADTERRVLRDGS